MRVLLLTQEGCRSCEQMAALFERLAVEYPLEVATLDMREPEAQAIAARARVLFPPGVLIDGASIGFGRLTERTIRREIVRRLREANEFCAVEPPGSWRPWRSLRPGFARRRDR